MTTAPRYADRPRWVLAFLAAVLAVAVGLFAAAPASATMTSTAQNAVGASSNAGQVAVGLSAGVVAGQRLGNDPPRAQAVVATGVVAETGAGDATLLQRMRGYALDDTGAVGTWSTSERIKSAGLPNSGSIRYVPPTNYRPGVPLPRGGSNGYIDRFGNEWVKGPSRTSGQPFEWDVQLSERGRSSIGWLSRDGSHVNVSLDGWVTH